VNTVKDPLNIALDNATTFKQFESNLKRSGFKIVDKELLERIFNERKDIEFIEVDEPTLADLESQFDNDAFIPDYT